MGLIKGIKRKVLPLLLSVAMASSAAAGLAVVPEISAKAETVPQAATLAREAAGEGMVLLKN